MTDDFEDLTWPDSLEAQRELQFLLVRFFRNGQLKSPFYERLEELAGCHVSAFLEVSAIEKQMFFIHDGRDLLQFEEMDPREIYIEDSPFRMLRVEHPDAKVTVYARYWEDKVLASESERLLGRRLYTVHEDGADLDRLAREVWARIDDIEPSLGSQPKL